MVFSNLTFNNTYLNMNNATNVLRELNQLSPETQEYLKNIFNSIIFDNFFYFILMYIAIVGFYIDRILKKEVKTEHHFYFYIGTVVFFYQVYGNFFK